MPCGFSHSSFSVQKRARDAALAEEEKQLEAVTKRFEKLEGDFMSAADQFARTRQFH